MGFITCTELIRRELLLKVQLFNDESHPLTAVKTAFHLVRIAIYERIYLVFNLISPNSYA